MVQPYIAGEPEIIQGLAFGAKFKKHPFVCVSLYHFSRTSRTLSSFRPVSLMSAQALLSSHLPAMAILRYSISAGAPIDVDSACVRGLRETGQYGVSIALTQLQLGGRLSAPLVEALVKDVRHVRLVVDCKSAPDELPQVIAAAGPALHSLTLCSVTQQQIDGLMAKLPVLQGLQSFTITPQRSTPVAIACSSISKVPLMLTVVGGSIKLVRV